MAIRASGARGTERRPRTPLPGAARTAPGAGTAVRREQDPAGRAVRRFPPPLRDDRGQAAVEFVGVLPVLLVTVALLWQAALVGYTFSLAGDAADRAARACAVGGDYRAAAAHDLPGGWAASSPSCSAGQDTVTAEVSMHIPVLFPGLTVPVNVTGHGAAVREEGP